MKYLALLLLYGTLVEAEVQNVEIKGAVLCDRKRLEGVEIELWARDSQDPEDLLDNGRTDADGGFEMSGTKNEDKPIEPFVRFTHNCNVEPDCTRITEYYVPEDKINSVYDMDYIDLDAEVSGERQEC